MPPRIPESTSSQTTKPTATPVETSEASTAPAAKPAPEQAQQPQQDPQVAAKVAKGSKQHAAEHKIHNDERSKAVQKQLAKEVPGNKAQSKKTAKESEPIWESVKKAGQVIAALPTVAGAAAAAAVEAGGEDIRRQRMEKLAQRKYAQDMIPGELYEVEKIVPGSTNKTETRERVENRSRGDVAERSYHPEQKRQSTQSALEDRLQELNPGGELTPFEKKLVKEWDPQSNAKDRVASLTPIKGLDSSGTKGPREVQAYKVETGGPGDRQIFYYDRQGNELNKRDPVEQLGQRRYPQDIVRGQMYEVEDIRPGSADKTETRKNTEIIKLGDSDLPIKAKDHPKVNRQATQPTLEARLKELNGDAPLTDFEKKVVSEWNPKDKNTTLTPIMRVDSKGEKEKEVQGYKVTVGGTGDRQTTYYDRNGNLLRDTAHSEKPLVNEGLGPIEYLGYAQIGKQILTKVGQKMNQKLTEREAIGLAKTETNAAAKAETSAAAKESSSAGQQVPGAPPKPREEWQDVNLANKQGGPGGPSPKTDPGRASTQQAPAQPPPAQQAPAPPVADDVGKASTQQAPQPQGSTLGSASAGAPIPRQPNIDPHPDLTPTRPGSFGTHLSPLPTDKQIFTVKTPKGAEKMTGEEYRLRLAQAEGWVIKNHRPELAKNVSLQKLQKEAQEKFGLNDGWHDTYNPIRLKIQARDDYHPTWNPTGVKRKTGKD